MTDFRSTRRWKELSARIIERDQVCAVCGTDQDMTTDHVIPISKGGAMWDEDNLVAMCRTHNSQKGNKTEGQIVDWISPLWIQWEQRNG